MPKALSRSALLAELRGKIQYVELNLEQVDRAAIDEETRTVRLAFASEAPYRRWFGNEILDTKKKSVRLDRLNDGGAVLVNHDRDQHVGVIESGTARMDADKKGRATARFGQGVLAQEVFNDVVDGIRSKVSVAYFVHDLVLEKKEEEISTYRVTDWEPFEVSIVSVPADTTVGIGRALDQRYAPEERKPMSDAESRAPDSGDGPEKPAQTVIRDFKKDNSQARLQAFDEMAARNREILAIGKTFEDHGAHELALKAIEDPKMTVDAFREATLALVAERQPRPTRTGQIEADRQHGSGNASGMSDREALYGANLVMFRGISKVLGNGMTDQQIAFRAGRWLQAVLHGNPEALRWCKDAGVQLRQGTPEQLGMGERSMVEGVFTSAGWLVPIELEASIIMNREQYGVARRICRMVPMSTVSTMIPRVTAEVDAFFVGEGVSGTAADSGGDQVGLNLKDLMAWTNIGKSTAQDSAIPLAEFVAQEQARSFARKEDKCLIIGDGTSLYGGMRGLIPLLEDANYSGGTVDAVSGHDLLPEIDTTDVTTLIGKLPVYARGGGRWLASGVADAIVFGRLKLTAGGNDRSTVQGQIVEQDYAGFTITIGHDMPSGPATNYNGKVMIILGNFQLGVAFGTGTGMMMTVDPYTLAHQNLNRVITTERIDIVAHGVNRSTTVAGPIVGLKGKT